MQFRFALRSRFVGLLALTIAGCVADAEPAGDDVMLTCDDPAPLLGEYDPRAPEYIILFVEGVDAAQEVARLSARHTMEVSSVLIPLGGFIALMSEETVQSVRCEPTIASISHDAIGQIPIRATSDQR